MRSPLRCRRAGHAGSPVGRNVTRYPYSPAGRLPSARVQRVHEEHGSVCLQRSGRGPVFVAPAFLRSAGSAVNALRSRNSAISSGFASVRASSGTAKSTGAGYALSRENFGVYISIGGMPLGIPTVRAWPRQSARSNWPTIANMDSGLVQRKEGRSTARSIDGVASPHIG